MENTQGQNQFLVPGAILTAGLIIAGAIFYAIGAPPRTQTASVAGSPESAQPRGDLGEAKTEGRPFIGSPTAPLTLAYWLDFQCSYCKKFEQETLPLIIQEYVNSGELKVVFKDLQFLSPLSQAAGIVGKAVWEAAPSQYLDWQIAMFDQQGKWQSEQDIIALAGEVGLDAERISMLLEQNRSRYQAALDADRAEAGSFGITGTPGFLIGGRTISGAQPFAVFSQVIDEVLQQQ
ncbi:MAG: thioredoxin domain-containing protein [Candidatus Yanofskybacteria bacterium]|nr:thioredoxin domain-containing protein [Candidatus Yanofskybacteria bacterium]